MIFLCPARKILVPPFCAEGLRNYGDGTAPMMKTFVPQEGQVPWVAGLPFFMVMPTGLRISLFALHLTQ